MQARKIPRRVFPCFSGHSRSPPTIPCSFVFPLLLLSLFLVLPACLDKDDPAIPPDDNHVDKSCIPTALPADPGSIFTKVWSDPADDFVSADPAYILPHPPMDVTQVSLGVWDGKVYVRFDFAGVIPTAPVPVAANPPVEAQTIKDQNTGVLMNHDGIAGNDILLSVRIGASIDEYNCTAYGINDLAGAQTMFFGSMGPGVPGYSYATGSFSLTHVSGFWNSGVTGTLGGDSRSASDLYEIASFDIIEASTWTIP